MKHLSLKIEKAGYVLNIPGISTMRTPCSIDISKLNIQQVLNSLSSNGIADFIIISSSLSSKSKNLQISKHDDGKVEILLESEAKIGELDYSKQLKEIDSKLDVILENIFNIPRNHTMESVNVSDKVSLDEEQIFIPNADIEGMKISQGNIDSTKMDSLDSSVNALKKIKKSKNK